MNAQRKVEEKVFSYMEEHHMINAGDQVVAGISGGADSVCLLFVLLEYRKKMPFSLSVLHVNHGIREEAWRDAEYVERLCRENDVPFFLEKVNVKEKAIVLGMGEEETGRFLRYEAFSKLAGKTGRVAVAHNANDRAETALFHLFRGSNIKGLASIQPVRENIIRPLLCLERNEIEGYLWEKSITWMQDATNEEDHYTRNRIRHHILPVADEQICAGSVKHICKVAEELSETEEYLQIMTAAAGSLCRSQKSPEEIVFSVEKLTEQHKVIQKRLIMEAILELSPGRKDIGSVHVEEVLALLTAQGVKKCNLPFVILARKEYNHLILEKTKKESSGDGASEPENNIVFQQIHLLKGDKIPENKYTKWFDYDKIKVTPVVRYRQTGDYLTIRNGDGELIHKSLKDYMITEKIPKDIREKIPVLAVDHHVLWLIGYRISEYFKVDENTTNILQAEWKERTEDKDGKTSC